ncbi:glycosyltransferase [Neobacillus sp. FSL H8-0543]|uniref:glycosyltransferase n=1 Tax=Neobacillus sp. FSL H8-0543 TaxID=2954672 RepID=UPI003158209D
MNIIINDTNDNIGGIEVMFMEMANYLTSIGHNVYFIVNGSSIYEKKLINCKNIFFVKSKHFGLVEYMSSKELREEKEVVLSQLNLKEEYYVISPYFQKLQYVMAVFNSSRNFKLINLWPHPEDWARQSKLIPTKAFTKKINKTPKYFYQRNLLRILDTKNANYYAARAVPVFNNWYYSIALNPINIETLPIQSLKESPKNFNDKRYNNVIKVLWCGRFDYFKNEAIIEVSKTLNSLAKITKYKIEYGIIGYGNEVNTNYIKQNVESDNIEIRYYGKVNPEDLFKVFKEYDIGVGMGLTVKKMAQVGLPAIVVDSFEIETEHKKNCNWLFDTSEGDAGDGYYYRIANEVIKNRQELSDVLSEVIENPYLLEEYSKRCLEYVEKYYSFEKQVQAILETAMNSTFFADDYPIFRRNIIFRFMYRVYKRLGR